MTFAKLGMAPISRSTDCGLIQTKVTRLDVNFGELFKGVRSSTALKGILGALQNEIVYQQLSSENIFWESL